LLPENPLPAWARPGALLASLLLTTALSLSPAVAQEGPDAEEDQPVQEELPPPPVAVPYSPKALNSGGIPPVGPPMSTPGVPRGMPVAPGSPIPPAGGGRPGNSIPADKAAQLARGEKSTLNLKDTDITALIALVSELTGQNFIVDQRVKGKVTVISSKPLSKEEVWQVFLSVLNVQGFAVVPGKAASKITLVQNAKQDAIPTVTAKDPGTGDEYVTRVVQVQNVPAAQMVPILRPLVSPQAQFAAVPSSNVLIISAEAANVDRIVKIIERIDVAGDESVDIVPLAHASASEIARVLQSLQKAEAKDQMGMGQPTIAADERTNSIIVGGAAAQRARVRTLVQRLDTPMEQGGNTEVVYLKYAKAKDLSGVLTGMSSTLTAGAKAPAAAAGQAAAAGGSGAREGLSIQPDESTNALVITANPDIMRTVKGVIRQLDVRRAQVLVEAIIAEISSTKAKELGVQWVFDGTKSGSGASVVNFSGSGSGVLGIAAALQSGNASSLSNLTSIDGASIAVGDTSGDNQFGAFLRALAGDGNTNILSTPSLVTLDNQEAEIVVGQNVPFVTGSYTNTGSSGTSGSVSSPFQTIQRQDVGITLKVRPQINEGDAVKLEVSQEVSSLSAGKSGATDLITNKRSLKTTVMVDNGQMVVLGGLIDDNLVESEQRVPLLGDIPIIGYFFSYKKTTKEKRNLMVFLHPVILRDEEQNAVVAGDKYTYMRARQLDMRERGVNLMSDKESPLMPELDQLVTLPPPFSEQGTPTPPPATPEAR
jgi:general secretion pathway protein D